MKDYSEWKPILDYENDSPTVDPSRIWLKHRPKNYPKTIKHDPIPVHEFLKLSAQNFPNNICIYDKPTDRKYTYREVVNIADRIANALHQLDIGKGDCVGTMSVNCPEYILAWLGILVSGAILVPINPLLKEDDVIHIVRDTGNMKAFFVHSENYGTIKKSREQVEIKHVILLDDKEEKENTITFNDFINGIPAKPPEVEIDPVNDLVALLFTGGTTGLPKGVMLTHNNFLSAALRANHHNKSIEEFETQRGKDVFIMSLPLCHIYGFITLVSAFYNAAMTVIFPFEPSEVLEDIEYYKTTRFSGVPIMWQMMINHPDFTERDLSSLDRLISGGAALAPELGRRFEEVVGKKIGQGYGMTETNGTGTFPVKWLPEGIKVNSVGCPLIDTDAKIVNPDTLEELKPNEVGEIMFKGPNIMKGYWKNPEATKKELTSDGWLRTGDLGRMDENGYFYIEGRTKDMVKYKGYKVMAREVEEKLMEHPAILEAGVVGIPDPNIGETIKAFVVLREGYINKVNEQEIIEWAKERIAAYKYPRHVEFIEVLPRTGVGKILRKALREREIEKL